ncbi:class E sortase [Candidatus Microgenomates bacterium]|nr:MAG: class E sortase [Candidatus Microgenomates bacterium]
MYKYIKVSPVTITIPVLPFLSVVLGASLLFWVVTPILSFAATYDRNQFVSPLAPDTQVVAAEETVDYSKVSNWLPKVQEKQATPAVNTYFLSIPKLGIYRAKVRIGTDDLSQNLIHYGGTGLPGKPGNSVIFGHSVLPAFFDPENYLTIFSLLPTLKEGDDIFVHYDGVDYRYQVIGERVTDPTDVSGLEQQYDDSYVTLVTCVPPGTYWKRLWLKLQLKPFGDKVATKL